MHSGMCTFGGEGKAKAETKAESEGEVDPDLMLCEHTVTNSENAQDSTPCLRLREYPIQVIEKSRGR